jgi:hypothetical protein
MKTRLAATAALAVILVPTPALNADSSPRWSRPGNP